MHKLKFVLKRALYDGQSFGKQYKDGSLSRFPLISTANLSIKDLALRC